jgi:hypothetical protein
MILWLDDGSDPPIHADEGSDGKWGARFSVHLEVVGDFAELACHWGGRFE